MAPMEQPTWPPSEDLLNWRPQVSVSTDTLPAHWLADEEGRLPEWLEAPAGDPDEIEIPVYTLAWIELDAGRPGGGSGSSVYAIPSREGDLRVVIINDDEIPFDSPIDRLTQLPTLGELLRILDETEVDGQVYGVGHPTRENSDSEHREELRSFITIGSDLYPQLHDLDQSRLDQWIAERP